MAPGNLEKLAKSLNELERTVLPVLKGHKDFESILKKIRFKRYPSNESRSMA